MYIYVQYVGKYRMDDCGISCTYVHIYVGCVHKYRMPVYVCSVERWKPKIEPRKCVPSPNLLYICLCKLPVLVQCGNVCDSSLSLITPISLSPPLPSPPPRRCFHPLLPHSSLQEWPGLLSVQQGLHWLPQTGT